MKTMMAVFAFSFAAALVVGASTPASARTPVEDTAACQAPIFDCCDGLASGTRMDCVTHGGTCGLLFLCGKPV